MDAGVFGVIVADLIAEPMDLRHPPASGSLTRLNSLTFAPGGNVCNVSIAMARLGMRVAAAGLVGTDALGQSIVEKLRTEGIDISSIDRVEEAQTSSTIVAIEPAGGQRSFFHSPGVTPLIDARLFRGCFEMFRNCAWVQIGYFGLLNDELMQELPSLLAELKQIAPGTKIALDTLDPPGSWEMLKRILPQVDLFAPSRAEAMALSGQSRAREMAEFFRRHMQPDAKIGIKLDSDGCYLDDGAHAAIVPAYDVRAIDTTGAGDAWFAGVLTALRKNLPLETCARFANRVAADCCSAIGASTGIESYGPTMARI